MKPWRTSLVVAALATVAGWAASGEPDDPGANLAKARNVVYVSSFESDSVLKFNADSGAFLGVFVTAGSGGLNGPTGIAFGPDGHLYVASFVFNNNVLRYDGQTGQFLDVFVEEGSGGLQGPIDLKFGPNGDLYVAASYAGGVFQYDGQAGAFIDRFTTGPNGAEGLDWHVGDLYISSHVSDSVIRYNGQNGVRRGPVTSGFLDWATGFDFGPDGNIYVASFFDNAVMKFNPQTRQWKGVFAQTGFGPEMIEFGPNGDLYVASYHGDSVDRFDGQTGAWKRSMRGNGLDGAFGIAFRRR
jgi:DNA-binding beta-propeller fold protein YncE